MKAARLEYGTTPRWHHRRRVRAAFVGTVVALGVLAYLYATPVKERIMLIWHQRQLARGLIPPDQVVFEEDPTAADALLKSGQGYLSYTGNGFHFARLPPPVDLATYPAAPAPFKSGYGVAPLFVGQLKDDQGQEAIVYVGADLFFSREARFTLCLPYGCEPLIPWTPQKLGTASGGDAIVGARTLDNSGVAWTLPAHRNLTLRAGVTDPKDPQRITIRYALNGENGAIECRLRSIGRMDVRLLDGPLLEARARAWLKTLKEADNAPPQLRDGVEDALK